MDAKMSLSPTMSVDSNYKTILFYQLKVCEGGYSREEAFIDQQIESGEKKASATDHIYEKNR